MRIVLALVKKEFLQIVRDPSALMIAILLPVILLFLFGYGVNLDSSRLRVGLVHESPGADSAALRDSFLGSKFFHITMARNRMEVRDSLIRGDLRGMVVIPAGFEKALDMGAPVSIQVVTDGSEPNSAQFVRNYAVGAVKTWIARRDIEAGGARFPGLVTIESRFRYNQELKSRNFLVPGSIAIIMTLIGVMLTSLVISREWERGTMEALMATPVTISQILLGKLIAYYLLALISAFLSWALAVFWYGVPFRGSIGALLILSSAYVLSALGQGLLISTLAKNQFMSAQMAIITGFLPSLMFSGFIFEIGSIPSPVQEFTYAVAARYLVPCLQTIFLVGDVWPLFVKSMACMLTVAAAFFILTARKTTKRIF